jgi:hypothetical protein
MAAVATSSGNSAGRQTSEGGSMGLEIVWRNPVPPSKVERRLAQAEHNECGALYIVTGDDEPEQFDVIVGGARCVDKALNQ